MVDITSNESGSLFCQTPRCLIEEWTKQSPSLSLDLANHSHIISLKIDAFCSQHLMHIIEPTQAILNSTFGIEVSKIELPFAISGVWASNHKASFAPTTTIRHAITKVDLKETQGCRLLRDEHHSGCFKS